MMVDTDYLISKINSAVNNKKVLSDKEWLELENNILEFNKNEKSRDARLKLRTKSMYETVHIICDGIRNG